MAIDKAAEMAKIQALIAEIPDAPAVPPTEHATDEDLADVDEVLASVRADAEEEEVVEAPPKKLAPVDDEDPIEKLLNSSREKRGGIHEAQTKADKILKDAEAQVAEMLRKADASITERAEKLLARMLQDPLGAAQETGVDPDRVLRATAESQDPNARVLREVRAELARRDGEARELRTLVQKLVTDREEEQRTTQREKYNRAQEKFLSDADEENYPAINLFWGKKRFLGEAFEESQAIHEAASVLGGRPEISDRQIIGRLEKRARDELKAVSKGLLALVKKLEEGDAAAKPEKGKAPKTISPSAGSASTKTAAATPKRFKDDRAEHAYLVKVAQEVLNKQAGRKPKVA